jgi:RNA polymerase sigma-70 factor, ECF subfamily
MKRNSISDRPATLATDEGLLAQYAEKGNREAFEELVHRYERELFNHLRKFLGSADSAEDAFQAAFLQIHLKCRQFEPSRKFRPWLFQIATNQAIDLLRRNRRHKATSLNSAPGDTGFGARAQSRQDLLEDQEFGPDEQFQRSEDRQRIRRALEDVPPRMREVIELVMFQGLRYAEAAKVLGIPVGSVKSRMYAAVQRLHAALQHTKSERRRQCVPAA